MISNYDETKVHVILNDLRRSKVDHEWVAMSVNNVAQNVYF